MNVLSRCACTVAALGFPILTALAGGSNYTVTPGANPDFAGKVQEWNVPTPQFARDPAAAPDGSIFIAVMHGNKIARFDPKTQTFKEWDLPAGAHPHGLLVDADGTVWYTGNGNGTIGHLDPGTGKVTEHKAPSGGDPHTIVTDGKGTLWFTVQGGGRVGRLDTRTGKITEYKSSGNPYGIALDAQGNVWFCRMAANKLGKIDPASGQMSEFDTGAGSAPRRMAAAPDGTLWVTLFGSGRLLHFDPAAGKKIKEYDLPAGARGGPYAVTVDGAGIVWTNEINTDTVVRLNPVSGEMRVIKLPSENVGIRKMIVDANGKLWYMGSHNGHLGVVQ
ncbi:MAG TPA: PQQ-binding-like beta-propeller repeat protein [Burkholderiales bacterium]|nr:PQQ-binding-like beta-propeller repeat protein [Burkholderiales bacterium]